MQITFRQMESSPALRDRIEERIDRLGRLHDRITDCRVVIEAPHRHHHKGKLYTVAVELQVPGGALASHRNPGQRHAHEDVYVAMRDAFDSVERQLHDYVNYMKRKTA